MSPRLRRRAFFQELLARMSARPRLALVLPPGRAANAYDAQRREDSGSRTRFRRMLADDIAVSAAEARLGVCAPHAFDFMLLVLIGRWPCSPPGRHDI